MLNPSTSLEQESLSCQERSAESTINCSRNRPKERKHWDLQHHVYAACPDIGNDRNPDRTKQEPPEINIELYSEGFFDGVCGLDATLPHFWDYWQGYQLGYREYCCGLLGVKIPESEHEPDRLATLRAIA